MATPTIRPDHVAAYIRWSTDDQATGTTLDVQRDACAHFIKSQGWEITDDFLYIDDGHSGGTLDRPAMRRLRTAVRNGQVDCVVVMKIDRLTRNIVDAVNLVLKEWNGRCHLKSVLEPIDTTTDLGRMIFGILAMFADFERSTIRERTLAGKVRRIRDGQQMHGRPAYGYANDPERKGRWLEDPAEAPVVRRIFNLAADGMGLNQITRLLNDEGIPTKRGKQWHSAQVGSLLHNQTYVGRIVFGRTSMTAVEEADGRPAPDSFSGKSRDPKTRRVTNASPRVDVATEAAPAIIGQEVFDKAQVQIARNRTHRLQAGSRGLGSPHLLIGIARCPCGTPVVHTSRSGKSKHAFQEYYVCGNRAAGLCRQGGYVPAKQADAIVEQMFLSLFGVRQMRQEWFVRNTGSLNDDCAMLSAAQDQVARDLARLTEEDERLLRAARAGKVDLADLADLRRSLRTDRASMEERLRTIRLRLDESMLRQRAFQSTLESLDIVEQWSGLAVWQKRQAIRLVLDDRITLARRGPNQEIIVEIPWTMGG